MPTINNHIKAFSTRFQPKGNHLVRRDLKERSASVKVSGRVDFHGLRSLASKHGFGHEYAREGTVNGRDPMVWAQLEHPDELAKRMPKKPRTLPNEPSSPALPGYGPTSDQSQSHFEFISITHDFFTKELERRDSREYNRV